MTKVKQILSRGSGVLSLDADASLDEALSTLEQAGVRGLPVVADGKVIGGSLAPGSGRCSTSSEITE